jgi:hypothetical protein
MVQNTRETRLKLSQLVVAAMDMESLVVFAKATMQIMYENTPDYFEDDAEVFDLEGVLAK